MPVPTGPDSRQVLFLPPYLPMTRRIRVLHIVRNLNDGGMERVVADLARAADPAVFEMHVMVLRKFGRFATSAGPHTTLHRAPRMTRLSVLRPAALAAAIKRIAPDVVHAHSGLWYKVARAARLAGVPVVYTDHGRQHPDPWTYRCLDREAARLTRRVVGVSRALGDYLVTRVGVPAGKVEVIVNGIDLSMLDARLALAKGEHRRGDAPIVIGTLGRLEPVKGYDVLLAALAQWPADGPRVEVLVAGDGSQRNALEVLAHRLDVADRIRFIGWVEEPELFYPLLDVFVLSSRSEGTSVSLLEAMAASCPPVVTNVGGNGEVLGAELRDWLVPSEDPAALVAKLVTLAGSATLRRRLGAVARARIAAVYDLSHTARRYADLYHSVVQQSLVADPTSRSPAYARVE